MLFRLLLFFLLAAPVAPAAAYSVLTHQAIVDTTWADCIAPLLESHYPGGTLKEMNRAKSYAYGGAILQDMGYYPLGSTLFTNLTHYVRSGDFVRNLLRQARNRNEYAFALGALAHYAADNTGHPEGTNVIIPMVYPDLKAKFGPVVTYEQSRVRHTEMEFSFDVVQVAAGRYRSQEYHKSIGFRVSKPVMERAFRQTYGIEMKQIFLSVDASVAMFRFAVNQLLPAAARAAWHHKHDEIRELSPRARRGDSLYHFNRRLYRREFGHDYERPGFGARLMAGVLSVLPKIGPLKPYAFTLPDVPGALQFHRSYQASVAQFCTLTHGQPADTTRTLKLADTNLDTGQPTHPTDYVLADRTYDELLLRLHKHKFKHLTPALRNSLLDYFANGVPVPDRETDRDDDNAREARKSRRKTEEALTALRTMPKPPKPPKQY
ncbi:zinc dependent phospholipase C family protein [Hymenobacter sp. M29]|uniref:Zinc dependent phospholipase C family protein n=1 Tax=Hymenobacter mellowenesis TaxID=3063995 RepID=A0ABT9A7P9_9BACT|nr:zinc dependent phospholipase C family protein [Hymenobacter sp. M29]MDO7845864.1 zinc dependent phospholipase C family protein [Hymenobacter sp. M29]